MVACDWLEDIAGPSDTHETGITVVPGSCERGPGPARPPSIAWQSSAIGAECNSSAAEHLADYARMERKAGRAMGLPCLVGLRLAPTCKTREETLLRTTRPGAESVSSKRM